MRNQCKKIIAGLLCAVLAAGIAGCNKGADAQSLDLTVWTAYSTEKILRDLDFSSEYGRKTLEIDTVRNEFESAQIVLSADTVDHAAAPYTVTVTDLTSAAGDTIGKDEIEIYHEKYLYVSTMRQLAAYGVTGYYPDALLPYETAVEYGENTVTGRNQAIWLQLKTKKTQPAGTYTGTAMVTCGGKTYTVPMSVRVRDYTLDDEVHSKTSFAYDIDGMGYGEQDTTYEMEQTYYEFYLNKRMNAQNLPGANYNYAYYSDPTVLGRMLDNLEKYADDPRVSSFNLQYLIDSVNGYHSDGTICPGKGCDYVYADYECEYYGKDKGYVCDGAFGNQHFTTFNEDNFEILLTAALKRGVETGKDLLKKAETYFLFFDEFNMQYTNEGTVVNPIVIATANYNIRRANEFFGEVADRVAPTLTVDDEAAWEAEHGESFDGFKARILDSCRNVRHKAVGELQDGLLTAGNATMVPLLPNYTDAAVRQLYIDYDDKGFVQNGRDSELWTYTCLSPEHPYPNYMIDTYTLSQRVYSWIRYGLDIVGDLYWATTAHFDYDREVDGSYKTLYDYYELHGFPHTAGDGYLTYPGRPYGIYGPVSTLRLEATCDGLEEYDLLYALERLYENHTTTENFDELYDYITRKVYSVTRIRTRDSMYGHFATARATLLDLLEAAAGLDVTVTSHKNEGGAAIFTVKAPADVELTSSGTVAETVEADSYKTVTFRQTVDKASNVFALRAARGGKTYDISVDLGAASSVREGDALADLWTAKRTDATVAKGERDGEKTAALTYKGFSLLRFDVSGWQVGDASEKIVLRVFNPDEEVTLNIYGKTQRGTMVSVHRATLAANAWTTVEIPCMAFLCNRNGNVTDLAFELLESNTAVDTPITHGTVEIGSVSVEG